jgi:hypothetical protein
MTAFAAQPTTVVPAEVPQPNAEERPELTITSDPSGAAVEINGVAVGTTPVTVTLTKGAAGTLTVKMDGYLPWTTRYTATVTGKFSMNANLMKEVFR